MQQDNIITPINITPTYLIRGNRAVYIRNNFLFLFIIDTFREPQLGY